MTVLLYTFNIFKLFNEKIPIQNGLLLLCLGNPLGNPLAHSMEDGCDCTIYSYHMSY